MPSRHSTRKTSRDATFESTSRSRVRVAVTVAEIVAAVVAVVAVTGCGKKTSETLVEKIIEKQMAKDGVKGKVDLSDGKMTIETPQGTATYSSGSGAKVPDNFPKDVQVYAGAKVMASVNTPQGQNLMLESGDSVAKIITFYKGKMSGEGWKEEMSMNQGESSVLVFKKEQRMASIVVARSGEGSQINLTVATEAK